LGDGKLELIRAAARAERKRPPPGIEVKALANPIV
jgi:hypothetical protein